MDNAKEIWAIIGVGIALAGLITTQHASLRQDMQGQFASIQNQLTVIQSQLTDLQSQITNLQNQITDLQNQVTNLVDSVARLGTHVGILREDVAGRRNEPESPPPDQPLEAP